MWKRYKPYIISVVIALAIGGLSAFLTRGNMNTYSTVNQPALAPPMWLFPVVWSILFILMGIGSAIIYVKREKNTDVATTALKIYAAQLTVNFFWSIIFFNMQAYLFAFVWLIVLWVLIIAMIVQFRKISSGASYLQIPYLLWVTFAGYLTYMVYLLNK